MYVSIYLWREGGYACSSTYPRTASLPPSLHSYRKRPRPDDKITDEVEDDEYAKLYFPTVLKRLQEKEKMRMAME